jgi:hypothetical protein
LKIAGLMEYQKMRTDDLILEEGDIRKLKNTKIKKSDGYSRLKN